MHYKKLYDKDTIGAYNLTDANDRPVDVTLTISRIEQVTCPPRNGKGPEKKPLFFFKERPGKRMICNITNGNIVAKLYGDDIDKWIGKRITLYGGTTRDPGTGGAIQGVMVRPVAPPERGQRQQPPLREAPPAQVAAPPVPPDQLPADWPECSCGAPVAGTPPNPEETCGNSECGGAS